MIDRKKLVGQHNPCNTSINIKAPLTVGNGEIGFTADITGMQTLYDAYTTVPLCTLTQWGWHTKPVKGRANYTLEDLEMTSYDFCGRNVQYPVKKIKGNEEVYDWLRENPHRLNLGRIRLLYQGRNIKKNEITKINQHLELYQGRLYSQFCLDDKNYKVQTGCSAYGREELGFSVECKEFIDAETSVVIDFPYGSSDITASNWEKKQQHITECILENEEGLVLKRTLDQQHYYCVIYTNGCVKKNLKTQSIEIFPQSERLDFSVRYSLEEITSVQKPQKIFQNGAIYWNNFWEKGGIIQLNQSQDKRAIELERRIILSQYLMAVNSSGSIPPQETGLTCNSWYGKMHLEMYLWHCGWLAHWNYGEMTERSLLWYKSHLHIAKKNAAFNGYKGARWPKMVGMEGIDCPSPIAPLLVWQQPHIIYMLEMVYRQNPRKSFLKAYWDVLKETVEFMVDYVVWNDVTGCYDICAPVIPVQERHQPEDTHNPAFEIEYWHFTLNIGCQWAERLKKQIDEKWCHVSEHMATLTEKEGVYLAHENCTETFEKVNIDHPSMLGAFGLIHSKRINKKVMEKTLQRVVEGWEYPTLWGWDFAMMAMTAVRLGKPELAIDILLKDTPKNCYLSNGHNMQISRKDLPLYLPGNGALLYVAAMMIAGFDGAEKKYPGFPDNGKWVVEYENIIPFI